MGAGCSVSPFPGLSLLGSPLGFLCTLCQGHVLSILLLLSPQNGLSPVAALNFSSRAENVARVAQRASSVVLPTAWAQLLFSLLLQKKPGSLIADRASCPGARAPAPVPLLAATLPEVLVALGAPGDLDGAGAGAGAKGQDRNTERWGLWITKLRVEGSGGWAKGCLDMGRWRRAFGGIVAQLVRG